MIFDYGGIKKIKIPFTKEEFSAFTINELISVYTKYMPFCLQVHNLNVIKEDYLYNYFVGKQDIRTKTRAFLGDDATNTDANQRVVENHANAQVTFKVDFLMGDEMQLTHKSDVESDDLTYLDNFLEDSGFFTAFRETKKMMYAVGIGTTYCVPRTDIIEYDENNRARYSKEYDKDTMSPFICEDVDPRYNFVVYSNYYGEEPLFCVSIIVDDANDKCVFLINNGKFTLKCEGSYLGATSVPFSGDYAISEITKNAFTKLPIIEHARNKERMGIIETNKDLLDVINLIVSNSADAIIDTVNNILVFENVEVDEETVKAMRRGGTIKVKSSGDPNMPSKVYTLEVKMNHSDVNVFYEQRVTKAYDIAGVPIASGVTTTGGQTGKARLLGGGWENAYTKIKGDIIGMKKSDYALLKLILDICRTVPDTKVNELSASQIEIKYNINPNDDILSKAQAANNLYNIGMPPEMILTDTGLSMDAHTDGFKWQQYIDQKAQKEAEKAEQALASTQKIVGNGDNNDGQNDYNKNKAVAKPKG